MAKSARGSVGPETFDAVHKLVQTGLSTKAACERVAAETGRSVGTVTNTYYRIARTKPGGGGVRLRPRIRRPAAPTAQAAPARRGPRPAAAKPTGDLDAIIANLSAALDALRSHAGGADVSELRRKAEAYDRMMAASR